MPGHSHRLTLAAMFLAQGVLLPILFHAVGLGSVFLPMYWPIAAAGFFLPFTFAVLVGVLTPALSYLLTGMPPVSPPILYAMVVELFCLAGVVSLARKREQWHPFWILLLSLLVSRTSLLFAAMVLARIFGLPAGWISIVSVLQGFPGVVGMLLIVPVAVGRIRQGPVKKMRNEHERNA